jgi:DNA repair protein RecN (Recombination protein N)
MIINLLIENYALISKANIDFKPGFSVITGETGAGKSIILGALGLVLGNRADISVLRDKTSKCIVELSCQVSQYNIKDFFTDNDLDYDDICIIRREISPNGKSRAFVNDLPVSLKILKDLSLNLIDIHSQHHTQTLMDKDYQLSVIDGYASLNIEKYSASYAEYVKLQSKCNSLKEKAKKESADADYYLFQFTQIDEANIQEGELEAIVKELETLSHAEDIKGALVSSHNLLDSEENSILSSVKQACLQIQKISTYLESADELSSRLDSVHIELQDISSEIGQKGNEIEYDAARIEWINARIYAIHNLLHKHSFETSSQLLEYKNELDGKLQNISSYDEHILALEEEIEEKKIKLLEKAKIISNKRKAVFAKIEKRMEAMLIDLGIANATFKIEQKDSDLSVKGIDNISFLFSANKNSQPQDLGKVASGGEMSRLMLSLKYLICSSRQLPSIIFDEIDTGVSGNIAEKMAFMMKNMSSLMQVISITHLPQIAAKGEWHYKVFKIDDSESTHSKIEILDEAARIEEVAQMLSGANVSDAAYHNAEILLQS